MFSRILTAIASLSMKHHPQQRPFKMQGRQLGLPTKLLRKTTLIPESKDHLAVHTLTFAIPDNNDSTSYNFISGAKSLDQVRIDLGDVVKMVIPNYKPKSYSISALRVPEGEFDVTFKVYPNGRASGFLNRLEIGETMATFGRSSNRRRNPGSYVGIIAYGVGITEGLPVAKAELEKGTADKVVLLWASRTRQDTFWQDKIQALESKYPQQFQIVYLFSREDPSRETGENVLHGRVNPEILEQVFQPPRREQARFLSVGTKEMMRATDNMLAQINYHMPENALLPKM